MVRAWHGRGMASVNQTRPHYVNQIRKTHSKRLAARYGRGTAWARHAMCVSASTLSWPTYGVLQLSNKLAVLFIASQTSHDQPDSDVLMLRHKLQLLENFKSEKRRRNWWIVTGIFVMGEKI